MLDSPQRGLSVAPVFKATGELFKTNDLNLAKSANKQA